MSPLGIYLICCAAYFASGPAVERLTGRSVGAVVRLAASDTVIGPPERLELTPEARQVLAQSPVAAAIGVDRLERIVENADQINAVVLATIPWAMFALMPLFALLTWAAWRSGGARYPAHLCFSLHVHAAFFAAITIPSLAGAIGSDAVDLAVGLAVLAYSTWYAGVAIQRVLGGSPSQVIWRPIVVGTAYSIAFLAVTVGVTVAAILQV